MAAADAHFQGDGQEHAEEDLQHNETGDAFVPWGEAGEAVGHGHADGVEDVDGEGGVADGAEAGHFAPVAKGENAEGAANNEVENPPLQHDDIREGKYPAGVELLQEHAPGEAAPGDGRGGAAVEQFGPATEGVAREEIRHELEKPGVAEEAVAGDCEGEGVPRDDEDDAGAGAADQGEAVDDGDNHEDEEEGLEVPEVLEAKGVGPEHVAPAGDFVYAGHDDAHEQEHGGHGDEGQEEAARLDPERSGDVAPADGPACIEVARDGGEDFEGDVANEYFKLEIEATGTFGIGQDGVIEHDDKNREGAKGVDAMVAGRGWFRHGYSLGPGGGIAVLRACKVFSRRAGPASATASQKQKAAWKYSQGIARLRVVGASILPDRGA